jgi:hypothetical protein
LTNIIILSSNRIILGLYDSKKNESIIREHILRIEDLQNNKEKFDCLGEGKIKEKKIINFIKINEVNRTLSFDWCYNLFSKFDRVSFWNRL